MLIVTHDLTLYPVPYNLKNFTPQISDCQIMKMIVHEQKIFKLTEHNKNKKRKLDRY